LPRRTVELRVSSVRGVTYINNAESKLSGDVATLNTKSPFRDPGCSTASLRASAATGIALAALPHTVFRRISQSAGLNRLATKTRRHETDRDGAVGDRSTAGRTAAGFAGRAPLAIARETQAVGQSEALAFRARSRVSAATRRVRPQFRDFVISWLIELPDFRPADSMPTRRRRQPPRRSGCARETQSAS